MATNYKLTNYKLSQKHQQRIRGREQHRHKEIIRQIHFTLNPDTKVEPDTLETMLDFMESRPDVGISGCKLVKG